MRKFRLILPAFLLLSGLGAQSFSVQSARDTLAVSTDSVYFLSHRQIFADELQVFQNGHLLPDYRLDAVNGRLFFTKPLVDTGILIVSYKYLQGGLPYSVGPRYLDLPLVAELRDSVARDSIIVKPPTITDDHSGDELYAAGTIYRNIEFSPYSGSDFSGGLRLQLQGSLGSDVQVNGILSDESLPIQPEGNTQTLDELDQVYLSVTHPQASVTAGDIEVNLQPGQFISLNRRLTGLKGQFKGEKFTGSAVFAGSKGNYREMAFKGADGNQGPYSLTSSSGSRDIIVIAGSERVFLDGQRLTRGENSDYTIDYSTAEIRFTARRLIHSDSDILVEYQYTDLKYSRSLTGGEFNRQLGRNTRISVSYIRETDNTNPSQLDLSDEELELLKAAGDGSTGLSRAEVDSSGNYALIDGIYVYKDSIPAGYAGDLYSVTFQNDIYGGAYVRKVTLDGHLYYHYVPEGERTTYSDLYSPVQTLTAPLTHQILQLAGVMQIGKNNKLVYDLALSDLDANSLSRLDDDNNLGWGYNLAFTGSGVRLPSDLGLNYSISSWQQSAQFATLQRDRGSTFNRDWNVDEIGNVRENMIVSEIGVTRREQLKACWNLSRYQLASRTKLRNQFNASGKLPWLPDYSAWYSQVQATGEYLRQVSSRLVALPGKWHPYYEYASELDRAVSQYDKQEAGLLFGGMASSLEAGAGQRFDWSDTDTTKSGLERISASWFGNLDYSLKTRRGLLVDLVVQKQLKENTAINSTIDFALVSANLSFFNSRNPLRIDLKNKLEETYTESRAVVYDSVGTGLGQYRYDAEFNEYIGDANGAYIAYTVLTGERSPTTLFEGTERIEFDFGKTRLERLRGLKTTLDLTSEYRGLDFSTERLTQSALSDTGISRARLYLRSEVIYRPVRKNYHFRIWTRNLRDLNGLDPRGQDLKTEGETGSELSLTLNRQLQVTGGGYDRQAQVRSNISALRDRKVNGFWLSAGGKLKIDRVWQVEAELNGGSDSGEHNAIEFKAQAIGLETNALRFIGRRGRLRGQVNWYNVMVADGITSLPPEALEGLAVGRSLRININGQILLGQNLTLNLTGSYLNDSRYDNLLTLNGEIRAFF